jgi:phosphoribosylglycinamide formyltransferase-1
VSTDVPAPATSKAKLGILLSGRGSNFLAIADNIDRGKLPEAEIAIVISNKAHAPGIVAAHERGFPAFVVEANGRSREEHDAEMISLLKQHDVSLVCLAGYMRLLSKEFVRAFSQRILNIHPSLLPAFPGLDAQRQAIEYGVKLSGCTVHFVDEELDHGVIILQKSVPVAAEDDEATLSARILDLEHVAYSHAISLVLAQTHVVRGRRYVPKS